MKYQQMGQHNIGQYAYMGRQWRKSSILRKMGEALIKFTPFQKKKNQMEQLQLKMWSTDYKIRGSDSFPANYPAQESTSTVAKPSFVQ